MHELKNIELDTKGLKLVCQLSRALGGGFVKFCLHVLMLHFLVRKLNLFVQRVL